MLTPLGDQAITNALSDCDIQKHIMQLYRLEDEGLLDPDTSLNRSITQAIYVPVIPTPIIPCIGASHRPYIFR